MTTTRVHQSLDGLRLEAEGITGPIDGVVDERLLGIARRIDSVLESGGTRVRTWHAVDAQVAGHSEVSRVAAELRGGIPVARLVIAVGGGTVLDLAKLASVAVGTPRIEQWCVNGRNRCGLVVLPRWVTSPPMRTVCMPTTIGTGAEVSGGATVRSGTRKRLLTGPQLVPSAAVLLPDTFTGLPPASLAEGVLEVLLRLVGPFVGASGQGLSDAAVGHVAGSVARLGDGLVLRGYSEPAAMRLARLSGFTHSPLVRSGRPPFASKLWYVANELSSIAGVRKMCATTYLLPAFWQAIMAGDERWGSATRLTGVWTTVREAVDSRLPVDPPAGVQALLRRWRIERCPAVTGQVAADAACSAIRAWGAGLPMLGAIGETDVRMLLQSAAHQNGWHTPAGTPTDT